MLNKLSHLSQQHLTALKDLVQKIVQLIKPDKIICYGTHTTTKNDWTTFRGNEDDSTETSTIAYDLLIITSNNEKKNDHEIIQTIEQQAELLHCHVTSVIQKMNALDKALQEGWRFFTTVYTNGIMLYDNSPKIIYLWETPPDMTGLRAAMAAHWSQYFTVAQKFYETAENCIVNNWPEGAIFNLHQSTQHTCMALLRAFTGYRSATHNLARLLELIKNFSPEPATIFPCVTQEEIELFNLLNKSYSDARYKEQYQVPIERVKILLNRVTIFMGVAERIYKERLHEVTLEAPISFPIKAS